MVQDIADKYNRVDKVYTEDALLLQLLSKAGAVFHVRTNQPQSLMVRIFQIHSPSNI
jgi:Asp-tRNA(Asn)/Glu-tRNA(Gln) amidotransferase A subunit family amidase